MLNSLRKRTQLLAPVAQRLQRLLPLALMVVAVFALTGHFTSRQPATAQTREPTALEATVKLQTLMTKAIARAEQSVVAIARVRKDRNVFDGSRIAEPRSRIVTPTNPDFVPDHFCSGVIVSSNGLILTNYHSLGNPELYYYWVWINKKPFKVVSMHKPAKVIAGDPWTDLALLKIDAANLPPIQLGDDRQLRKGQIVISLGNPYAIAKDGQVSASWGIISNLGRSAPAQPKSFTEGAVKDTLHHYGTLIQTDARLNFGTSGGALIDLRGRMIGLTTSIAALTGYESAAGFAIPANATFRRVVNELKQGKRVDFGFLGLSPGPLEGAERRRGRFGAIVRQVVPGTPAAKAGLKAQDIITHVNSVPVYGPSDLSREIGSQPALNGVELRVFRGRTATNFGRPRSIQVELSKQFVELQGPAYSQQVVPSWRGLQVDYATAVPPEVLRSRNHLIDKVGCVAVNRVARDSPAWKAGLRPGEFISHINSQRISTPAQFFETVGRLSGNVTLRSTSDGGLRKTVKP